MSRPEILSNSFLSDPEETPRIETRFRRIQTSLPAPETTEALRKSARLFPRVNCYQPPVIWDSADGLTVTDPVGNRWIDFTSTAVMTNTGHGHQARTRATSITMVCIGNSQ